MHKKLIVSVALLFAAMFSQMSKAEEKLDVAFLVASADQRLVLTELINEFANSHPDINVSYTLFNDTQYKKAVKKWLNQGYGPDVINWQAGERLMHYVRTGKVQALDTLWKKHHLETQFLPNTKAAITWQGSVYAIPVTYYYWGMYYRKSLFKKYGLTEPTTWQELLSVAKTLKANNITPFTLGTRYHWPAAAWFDYLNLRINGLAFHQRLLSGHIPFTDNRVRQVFIHWKELIDKDYFIDESEHLMWDEAMFPLFRKQAAMTLIGTFLNGRIPDEQKPDFGFFRFPIINPQIGVFEDAPLDVFILPYYSAYNSKIERFISFIAGASFQQSLNKTLGTLSANINAEQGGNEVLDISYTMHQQADGTANYFDRDAPVGIAEQSIEVFSAFLTQPDIDSTLLKLEAIRKQIGHAASTN
ncbi:ABC transporter substrate-binding protein [Paraglaciecola aquimarina]|uniref:ABC transporter substrate-binding protein n=1 Tax=Paraglaciecola aquimarina TaxID=1235557 RepID=A0ABU3ST50_9ALTE|nr:ABC transporter substrate-binding protein [Paraglaciecola aquimarina]MDU0353183.1 ABC transporter substrate-binding protein [Paraglaciecola aquimarina]